MASKSKRKVRPGIKNFLYIVVIVIVGLFVIKSDKFQDAFHSYRLENAGYTSEEAKLLIRSPEVYEYAINNGYNSNLAKLVASDEFDNTKTVEYLEYLDENDNAPIEDAIYLINNGINSKYSKVLMNIVGQKYFLKTRIDRYLEYAETSSDDYETIVAKVNANRDYSYYDQDIVEQANINDQSVLLVNKYYYLDKSFNPKVVNIDLEYAWEEGLTLNSVAYSHFVDMQKDAAKYGYSIIAYSAYRTYEEQETVYNGFVVDYGKSYADKRSSRPGYSEHQTGLSVDVISASNDYGVFEETNEYLWMKDNCYKYGFILRYPKGKEDITGYSAEAWHYRYVGVEAATIMYNEDLTLEEYYAYYVIQK